MSRSIGWQRIAHRALVSGFAVACAVGCSDEQPSAPRGEPGGAGELGGAGGTSSGGAAGTSQGGNTGSGGSGASGGASAGGASGTAGTAGAAGAAGTAGSGGRAGAAGTAGLDGGSGTAGRAGSGGAFGSAGAAGSSDGGNCMTPPAPSPLVGWASVNERGQNGTTGGGTAAPVVVTSTSAFNAAAAGTAPAVIHVSGSLTGTFTIGSNKTVIGVCGAVLRGHVHVSGSVNVIVRNLRLVGNNCTDSPDDCSAGADAMSITNNAHHVWVDHLDVSDGSDGNLDINAGSDLVTISWTKFSYSTRRSDPLQGPSGHRFSNLIGSGDDVTTDAGRLRVTFHHSWWADNVDQRMPRTRYGNIHVFNNLYTSAGNSYCTNAGIQTHLLVENNVYIGVNRPLSPDANGDMLARGNLFTNTTPSNPVANGVGFTPPYAYTLGATSTLAATLQAQAGPR